MCKRMASCSSSSATRQVRRTALSASLRRVDLAACGLDDLCQADTLAVLPVGPDNFEGMTLLDSRHLLLVSDNASLVTRDTLFVLLVWP